MCLEQGEFLFHISAFCWFDDYVYVAYVFDFLIWNEGLQLFKLKKMFFYFMSVDLFLL